MAKLIFLGTSNAISDENHENTHMVLVGKKRTILIDCPNSPILRLRKMEVDFNTITDLITTHFHPDHVSGVPQLLMDMWLLGRKKPLTIHGLTYTIDRIETLMDLYNWKDWPNFFPVTFHSLLSDERTPVLESPEFNIHGSPVQHFIPTMGLRIEFVEANKVIAFSSDTEPCEQVIRLADGADLLIHEASGALPGHSSAAQAGEAASRSEVGALYLVHYPSGQKASMDLIDEAKTTYQGPIEQAQDFMVIEFE
jgi:ribonuclease Z